MRCRPSTPTEPSDLIPQMWKPPAVMEAKAWYGVDWRSVSLPQHSTAPFGLSPHVCQSPALTEANWPPGGVAWPTKLPSASAFEPQHTTPPSVLTPHVWTRPALTEANANGGGVA